MSSLVSWFTNINRDPLSYRLLFWILFLSAIFTLIITCIQLYSDYRNDRGTLDHSLDQITDSSLPALGNSLWALNTPQLDTILLGILNQRDMVSVEVIDYYGNTISRHGEEDATNTIARSYPIVVDALGYEQNIGVLHVTATLNHIYQSLYHKALVILATQGLKTFLMSFCILLLVELLIIRHLKTMGEWARKVGVEQLDRPLVLDRASTQQKDAFDYLLNSVNQMRDGLNKELVEREKTEKILQKSEERFKAFFNDNPLMLCIVSEDGIVDAVNDYGIQHLGYEREDIINRPVELLIHEDDKIEVQNHLLNCFIEPDKVHQYELRKTCKNGSIIWVRETVRVRNDASGNAKALIVCEDISERKETERALKNRTDQLLYNQKTLFKLAKKKYVDDEKPFDEILKTDANQLKVERVCVWLFNQEQTELKCKAQYEAGKPSCDCQVMRQQEYPVYFQALKKADVMAVEDVSLYKVTSEYSVKHYTPAGITSILNVPILLQGEVVGVVCHEHTGPNRAWSVEEIDFANSIADLCALVIASNQQKRIEEKLNYQANHDSLTGLVNRREFEARLKKLLMTSREEPHEHALCYMDLDQFKVVNDTCGHVAGDELLRQLSISLSEKIRQTDTFARLGGDEFGLLIEHCALNDAVRVAESIKQTIDDFQFLWEGRSFNIGVSMGLVSIADGITNQTELLKAADAACYMAKEKGRNRIHIYHREDDEILQRQDEMQWVSHITHALESDAFCLHAQPICPLAAGYKNHYEILIRMRGESGELIPPGAFLPAAERYNMIQKLDRWVIKQVFEQLSSNQNFVEQIDNISINLSGQSIADEDLLNFIIAKLNEAGVSSNKICFEITETAAISNMSTAMQFIKTLSDLGCYFALDDFGSGLSSFGYLKNLPVHYLKIDGMFVKDIVDDPIDRAMVKSINEIGQVMGMKTIAEFVENDIILGMLKEIGVDYAQGYGIGEILPFEELIKRSDNVTEINPSISHQ